jgi:hypothetical protein
VYSTYRNVFYESSYAKDEFFIQSDPKLTLHYRIIGIDNSCARKSSCHAYTRKVTKKSVKWKRMILSPAGYGQWWAEEDDDDGIMMMQSQSVSLLR